jgi:hypothetical protein
VILATPRNRDRVQIWSAPALALWKLLTKPNMKNIVVKLSAFALVENEAA